MKTKLPDLALFLILALLPLLPVLAGKLWVWQALVVVLILSLAGLFYLLASRAAQGPAGPWWRMPGDLLDWCLALFILWSAFSWFTSVYRFATEIYLAKLIAFSGVFWLLRYAPRSERLRRAGLWALVAGGALLAVLGLREYVRTVHFLGDANWRVFGPMFNPNIAAGYLLLTIFPALGLLFGAGTRSQPVPPPPAAPRQGKRKRLASPPTVTEPAPRYAEIAAGFAILMMLATLLLTGSKAALGAFLVGGVVFGLLAFGKDRKGRLARLTILGFVALTILLAFILPPIRERLVSAFGWQSHSAVFRAYTWQATLHMIGDRPWLGFGAGAFEHAFPGYALAGFTRQAHQAFMQIAAETGLPALLLGLAFGVLLLGRLWNVTRREELPLPRLVAAAAVAALVASAVQELVDYAWYVPAVGLSFFALSGLALGMAGESAAAPPPVPRALVPWRWTAVVLAALLTVWSATCLYAETVGARGDSQAAAQLYRLAADTYARAGAINPAQARFAVQESKVAEALGAGGEDEALARAIARRQRAIALQPTEPLHHLALARLYELDNRLAEALVAAQEALRRYPRYPRGLAQVGRLQQLTGRRSEALQTFKHLAALHASPVGQYPPVLEMQETAFVHGWIGVGDEHWEQGRRAAALLEYYRAARLLRNALMIQVQAREFTGEAVYGHLEEDAALARELRTRLMRDNRALTVMLMVELHQAQAEHDEARQLLEYVEQGRAETKLAADRLAQAWARLELAAALNVDKQEEAALAMAKMGLKAVEQVRGAAADEPLAQQGWGPFEQAWLQQATTAASQIAARQ